MDIIYRPKTYICPADSIGETYPIQDNARLRPNLRSGKNRPTQISL